MRYCTKLDNEDHKINDGSPKRVRIAISKKAEMPYVVPYVNPKSR